MGSPVLWTTAVAVTAVRNSIQDPASAASQRWTNAEIVSYLNRALLQLVADVETPIETSWTSDITEDEREIALPAAHVKPKVVEYIKSASDVRRLEYLNREEYEACYSRDPTKTGEPTYYFLWAKKGEDPTTYQPGSIYLVPTPNATAAGTDKLRIWGYKVPDELSYEGGAEDNTIELEPPYIEAMLQFAAGLVKQDDGDHAAYDRMMANYERMVRKIMDLRSRKSKGSFQGVPPRSSSLSAYSRWAHPGRRPWLG